MMMMLPLCSLNSRWYISGQWAAEHNSAFNSDKFACIRYHCNKDRDSDLKYLADNGSEIEFKQHVKDLGVTVSDNGTFKQHIQNVVLKARQKLGLIFRTFHTRVRFPTIILWKQLVRPRDLRRASFTSTRTGSDEKLLSNQLCFWPKLAFFLQISYIFIMLYWHKSNPA